MNDLQIFDRKELFHYTENDMDLVIQILQMALQDLPDFFKKAQKNFSDRDKDAACQNVHSIKGISGTTGALRVHFLSSSCEDLLKSNHPDKEILKNMRNLEDEIERFCSCNDVLSLLDSNA